MMPNPDNVGRAMHGLVATAGRSDSESQRVARRPSLESEAFTSPRSHTLVHHLSNLSTASSVPEV